MNHREESSNWFKHLRDEICLACEKIEQNFADQHNITPSKFERDSWNRDGGGGGVMSVIKGNVFEKMGVNISTVHGEFSEMMQKEIPGTDKDPKFFATGISLVMHAKNPFLPAIHFNTRYIETQKSWFGGGGDMTPTFQDNQETELFHSFFKKACDKHDPKYYPDFKKQCDEYFYIPHRKEPRGVGGIFYDYLNTNSFENDFAFTQDVGKAILASITSITENKMNHPYSKGDKEAQLIKRGRYVEFNLLYDRGTKFGLMTGGNIEAIFMSLPPEAKW